MLATAIGAADIGPIEWELPSFVTGGPVKMARDVAATPIGPMPGPPPP